MAPDADRPRDRHSFEELDRKLLEFEHIQSEIDYKLAQNALRQLLANLDLSARERVGLEAEIERLAAVLDKLERAVVQLAVFGAVGCGKSSLLNALLGREAFQTGPLHGVTRAVDRANWLIEREPLGHGDCDVVRVAVPTAGAAQVQLVDTPGIDEVDGETRELLAHQVAKRADLLLFAIAGDLTQVEFAALSQLREVGKPMLVVFNKVDRYPDTDREAIYQKLCSDRLRELLTPDEIVLVAAAPLVKQALRRPDGSLGVRVERGAPQIQDLKNKILDILTREGKALIALNSLLYADEVNEQLLKRKVAARARAADETIWRATLTKATAVALNPVTVLDLFTGAAIDVATILSLSRLYGLPMTQPAAIALLKQIAFAMGGLTASELLATLGLSSLKGLLGVAAPATGGASMAPYLSVALAQAGVAGISTYAIAHAARAYLANGASWGPEGPKTMVRRILDSLDKTSILYRIKDELGARLHRERPAGR
ncbi:GTP-binding protein [Rubidibacter lacunae]|uniref:GTP-binding protein n=1 Tax=Rubidibacter lacunae TaxID=582514 RepID=UPI00041828C2|nr:GTP-binding protein [Rubidibacter lacunae]